MENNTTIECSIRGNGNTRSAKFQCALHLSTVLEKTTTLNRIIPRQKLKRFQFSLRS